MLKEHTSVIDQCSFANNHSEQVKTHFIQILSIDWLREAMTCSLEVETQGLTLKEFGLKGATTTMAYDGENVRCLCIKVGGEKPVSVLTSNFDTVESAFNEWAARVLDQYI